MIELLIECIFLANLRCSPNTIDPDWPRRLLTLRIIMDHKITPHTMLWGEMVWKGSVKFGAHIWNVGQVCIFIHKHRLIDGLDVAWMGGSALFFSSSSSSSRCRYASYRFPAQSRGGTMPKNTWVALVRNAASARLFILQFLPGILSSLRA